MKLKTNSVFTKAPRTKIINKKNKDWNWNINNKEDHPIIVWGEDRKEKKKQRPH
jgi:hypothetical protein